jgi:hypothetical protein
MLGHGPDEADESVVSRLLDEIDDFGEDQISELAARGAAHQAIPSVQDLITVAREQGFDGRRDDAVAPLESSALPAYGEGPAWRRGVAAARELRSRERLGGGPIPSARLAEIAGVKNDALERGADTYPFSYEIERSRGVLGFVPRSKWDTGRRFDMARLVGDLVAVDPKAKLRSATDVSTYRQQLQKAFAAEFLAPIDAVDEFLAGDYGEDKQDEAAKEFTVSPMMINALLKNNNRIERADDELLDHVAAA